MGKAVADVVTRTLYRALLNASADLERSLGDKISCRREIRKLRHYMPEPVRASYDEAIRGPTFDDRQGGLFRTIVRESFKCDTDMPTGARLDAGFGALWFMGERTVYIRSPHWVPKSSKIALSIGQIFRHKKYGFRGVIIDSFDRCPMDNNWIEAYGPFKNGPDQPFYRTLIDTRDRPNALHTIAAGENLELIEPGVDGAAADCSPVSHPMLADFFDGFEEGRHLMNDDTAQKFPEDDW